MFGKKPEKNFIFETFSKRLPLILKLCIYFFDQSCDSEGGAEVLVNRPPDDAESWETTGDAPSPSCWGAKPPSAVVAADVEG